MSEYEIVSLFHEVITGVNASMTNFLTVLMAMLVVSYLVANRLDRPASLVVVVLYSIFMLGMINEIYSGYRDFAAIGREMARMGAEPGASIGWHPTVMNGGAGLDALPFIILSIALSSFLASLWFFFHARKKPPASARENLDQVTGSTEA